MPTLDIRLTAGGPVYQQIVDQVKYQIATGRLAAGLQMPTVRDLAQRLRVNPSTVAKAYVELERQGIIVTRRGGGSFVAGQIDDPFVSGIREERLSNLTGRAILEALSMGFQPEELEASFALQLARWRENRARAHPAATVPQERAELVFVGSHDLALELLFGQLRRACPAVDLSTEYVGSLAGLIALERGEAHLAGCHLLDEETQEFNTPYVRRLLPSQDVVLVTVVERRQGLIVPKDNPLGITGLADLARPGVRMANRQRGSGTRVMLDFKLSELGLRGADISGYDREEQTHVGVATAVAEGTADLGLGIFAAARALGLDFLPLVSERYDLAMSRSTFEAPIFQQLLQILQSVEFRAVVASMGGYDLSSAGQLVPTKASRAG